MAKDKDNTRILDIGGWGVLFYFISIKLYYKDVNLGDDYSKDNYQMNNGLNAKLRHNLLRKRGYLRKLD
jgi:hypothetical protein